MTKHAKNWLVPSEPPKHPKAVCGVRRPEESFARTPQEITCDICSLRVLRSGQNAELSIDDMSTWEWTDIQNRRNR